MSSACTEILKRKKIVSFKVISKGEVLLNGAVQTKQATTHKNLQPKFYKWEKKKVGLNLFGLGFRLIYWFRVQVSM
jgi:hypothetical protein